MDSTVGDVVLHLKSSAPSRSQLGYDRLAPSYRATEWLVFGNRLQRARVALIDGLQPWSRLLILGDGNGRLLESLCAKQLGFVNDGRQGRAQSRITSLDHSLRMLRLQQARVQAIQATDQVDFIHADARDYAPEPGAFDVVVTPFFLDCFSSTELERHLPSWMAALRVGGNLLNVDFIVPRSVWQRPRGRVLLWAMHVYFHWQTGLANRRLVDTRPLLEQCGLSLEFEQISGGGMIAAQRWCRVT